MLTDSLGMAQLEQDDNDLLKKEIREGELLDKRNQINFEGFDTEEFLDKRDCNLFDCEWIRVYQAIEALKNLEPFLLTQYQDILQYQFPKTNMSCSVPLNKMQKYQLRKMLISENVEPF